ncbi:MAG: hypothetical protein QXZ17_06885 [Nitrososphaerota archaeon]
MNKTVRKNTSTISALSPPMLASLIGFSINTLINLEKHNQAETIMIKPYMMSIRMTKRPEISFPSLMSEEEHP